MTTSEPTLFPAAAALDADLERTGGMNVAVDETFSGGGPDPARRHLVGRPRPGLARRGRRAHGQALMEQAELGAAVALDVHPDGG